MVVAVGAPEGEGAHALGRTRLEFEARAHKQGAVRTDKFGEMGETFQIVFLVAVDVEMVGVGGVDNRYVGRELMERAVVLVGLDDRKRRRGRQHKVAVVLSLHDAPQKGIAARGTAVEDVCGHRRGCGLAVGARKTEALAAAGDLSEHPGALVDFKPAFAEERQRHIGRRHGGGVNHQSALRLAEGGGHGLETVVEADLSALALQMVRKFRGGAVVACHRQPQVHIVSGEGGHAYAADAYKVYSFGISQFHWSEYGLRRRQCARRRQ